MIISEKQIMKLLNIAQAYMAAIENSNEELHIVETIAFLLREIQDNQSEELKVIE